MQAEWSDVMSAIQYFKAFQKKYGYVETTNAFKVKYDMRDVMSDVGDNEEFKLLIKFFMYYPDGNDRSFSYFFRNYDTFLETMRSARADLKRRKALANESLRKKND